MDFTKFVSLISSSNLFFCRADLFKDPFEGSYSKANVVLRPQAYQGLSPEHIDKIISNGATFSKWIREWTYISCWHANEFESAAMWDLYAKTDEAVAIETKYSSLKNVLPDNSFLGLVKYIDYEKDWLPEGNTFYPFTHKVILKNKASISTSYKRSININHRIPHPNIKEKNFKSLFKFCPRIV